MLDKCKKCIKENRGINGATNFDFCKQCNNLTIVKDEYWCKIYVCDIKKVIVDNKCPYVLEHNFQPNEDYVIPICNSDIFYCSALKSYTSKEPDCCFKKE